MKIWITIALLASAALSAYAQDGATIEQPVAPVAVTNAPQSEPAAAKAPSPIGKWSSHPPDQTDLGLTMILHADGRFEQAQDDAEWGGTFKFLNDEHTKVERTCRNGNVFTLEYDPKTDTMMQNDGAPYTRIKEEPKQE